MSYNGWTNYETWRINLELCDGLSVDDFGHYFGENHIAIDRDELAEAIKDYCKDYFESETKDDLSLSIINYFLQSVNWHEIANRLTANKENKAA